MRLKKIKLAGFKSFVDPTSLPLPSNCMAVVGPNGCGKSNIIDAVRWVMGESSAKHLRGDSMADVIFNGSTSRKPVGQCSVELVFDNSQGSLGGQYANYNEIALKRQVTRDGQSHYFLNGARCRRRDITDIFLGTGLGPRSYAIIEQGMISRLIEAKPEELRVFLEEAAGISRYKERRRETENRIRHTTENLDRLNDLREEIERQLNTLKRQARNAEKYQELKQAERKIKARIQALHWQALEGEAQAQNQSVQQKETALEARGAELRQVEAHLEHQRGGLHEARDEAAKVQETYYNQGAEIARLEQQLHHEREQWSRQQQEWEQAQSRLAKIEQTRDEKSALIEQTQQALTDHAKEAAEARQQGQESQGVLEAAEASLQAWQAAWEEFNQRAAEPTQAAQVERTRQQQLERQQQQLQHRLLRLEEEAQELAAGDEAEQLDDLQKAVLTLEQQVTQRQEALTACAAQMAEQRAQEKQISREFHHQQGQLNHLQGRLTSLQALQQAALGAGNEEAHAWLKRQGLAENPRLAESLRVESGWEQAVECVLGIDLEAVCVEGVESLLDSLEDRQEGNLILFDTAARIPAEKAKAATLLAGKIQAPWPLSPLLAGIYAVETLAEAIALNADLALNESVITRSGIWLGPGWLRLTQERDEKTGVLARGREIEQLEEETVHCRKQAEILETQLEETRRRLHRLEGEREQHQNAVHALQRERGERQAVLARREAQVEQQQVRRQRVHTELEELRQHLTENQSERQQAEGRLQSALADIEVFTKEREGLIAERDQVQAKVTQGRSQATAARDAAHQLAMRGQTLQTTLEAAQQGMTQARQEQAELLKRQEALAAVLADGQAPLQALQERLETHLQQRVTVENQLSKAREQVTALEGALRRGEQEKHRIEKAIEAQRTALERLRVDGQAIWVRAQTLREQLNEAGFSPEEILQDLPSEHDLSALEAESERIAQHLQRLGLINLAAIDECRIQAERKQYLDSQHTDLTEALQALESAIRRIDRETRSRFRDTFERVNGGLQALFPKLFGGGKASLELDDNDLLNTGVRIMAQPPGKRNSTIHLLSGGEKALTAVALVFAIFQLNPAPFCMLDEVDAPLDDANVGRFCSLVREMSEKVQFIIVTHNKTTMELGYQLTGVTMHEPGVSRLVAVDVDEAVQLAAV